MISAPTPGSCSRTSASSMPLVPPGSPTISCHRRVRNIHSWSRSPAWPNGASRLRPSPVPKPSSETEKNWTRPTDMLVLLPEAECRRRWERRPVLGWQDFNVSVRSVYANPLPVPDQLGRPFHSHNRGKAVFPGDDRAMGHQAPDLGHETLDRNEERRPAGVRVGGHEDVAGFEIGLRHVEDDA